MARSLPREEYTIAWICALPVERTAAEVIADELHQPPKYVHADDHNSYTLGSIGEHNIVILSLPSGRYGTSSALNATKEIKLTFPSISLYFLVGIGGGVPSETRDIRLGDVVVSHPEGVHGGVVQYDLGKTVAGGRSERTGHLNKPPQDVLTAIAGLRALQNREKSKVLEYITDVYTRHPNLSGSFEHQGHENDRLFNASYSHEDAAQSCDSCRVDRLVSRTLRQDTYPVIHYGTIASGNQVIKDGISRDEKAQDHGAICFEMEAAGLMDYFPCLVVRGICDYCDSHKNKRWQPYAALVAAAYTKELLTLLPQRVAFNDAERIFNIPGILHRHFSGRQQYLNQIHDVFHSDPTRTKGVFVTVFGMPGLGKTQLCLKYATENKDRYKYIFYAIASTPGQWYNGCDNIIQSLKLPEASLSDQDARMQALQRWLAVHRNWLLIIDDITSSTVDSLRKTLPSDVNGNILASTRDRYIAQDFSAPDSSVALREMDLAEGKALVLKIFNKQSDSVSDELAEKISEKLGGLPLALEQGTTCAIVRHWELGALLDKLGENKGAIVRDRTQNGHHADIITTLNIALKELQPPCVATLNLILFMRPQALPLRLIKDGVKGLRHPRKAASKVTSSQETKKKRSLFRLFGKSKPEKAVSNSPDPVRSTFEIESLTLNNLMKVMDSEWNLEDAIVMLEKSSLIQRGETGQIWVHDLVQEVLRENLESTTRRESLFHAAQIIAQAFPFPEYETWDTCRAYLPHSIEVLDQCVKSNFQSLDMLRAMQNVAIFYENISRYDASMFWYERALPIYERVYGKESSETMILISNMANVHMVRSEYEEALRLFDRAIASFRKEFGENDQRLLDVLFNKAGVLEDQKRYDEALKLYEQLRLKSEAIHGKDHAETVDVIHVMATVFRKQGKPEEAIPRYRNVLAHRKRTLGESHPQYLDCVYNLGVVLNDQGDFGEAMKLLKQALEGYKTLYGDLHLNTLNANNCIVLVLEREEKFNEAIELCEKTLAGRREVLGPQHPHTLISARILDRLKTSQQGKIGSSTG